MAFTITPTKAVVLDGIVKVYGTATNGGSDTSGTIDNTDLSSLGVTVREILGSSFTNVTSSAAFRVVKTYDATADGDLLTLTCGSGDSFDFIIEGKDEGSYTFG